MKRGLFQIHLSTAIVLMFVAGGLLWMNFRQHRVPVLDRVTEASVETYGWPDVAYKSATPELTWADMDAKKRANSKWEPHPSFIANDGAGWKSSGIAINGFCALLILMGTVLICESRIADRPLRNSRRQSPTYARAAK